MNNPKEESTIDTSSELFNKLMEAAKKNAEGCATPEQIEAYRERIAKKEEEFNEEQRKQKVVNTSEFLDRFYG